MGIEWEEEGLSELRPSSWIHKYLLYTEGQESPTRFHVWSAISCVASTLARNAYMYRGYYAVYPNQYIILVAESAMCRKSTAANIAIKDILTQSRAANLLRQKMTAEFLCVELAKKERINNAVTIYAPELAVFLGSSAFQSGLIPLLTDLYDCPADADYKTKGSGEFLMKNVCINIMGCTTLDWMSNNMPGDTIEGGFTGRVLFVVAEDPRKRVAWPSVTEEQLKQRQELIYYMMNLAKKIGEFKPTKKAREVYEDWYNQLGEPKDPRLRGYQGRKGDHVLKVAMSFSAADDSFGTIDEPHIRLALGVLNAIEKLMPLAFRGAAFSKTSKDVDRVLRQLEKLGGKATHSILLKRNAHYINAEEFRKVMDTLKETGDVAEETRGRARTYRIITK